MSDEASATLLGRVIGDRFGSTLAVLGDVNGDGFGDLGVGAPAAAEVEVFLGGAGGVSGVSQRRLAGAVIAGGGDVDADGFDDLLVADPTTERLRLYLGSSAGIGAAADQVVTAPAPGGAFGTSAAIVGDTNGDGFDDVLVGAPLAGGTAGIAYLFLGSAGGLRTPFAQSFMAFDPQDFLGAVVAAAGDLDADGYDDAVTTVPGDDIGANLTGAVLVLYGGAGGLQGGNLWFGLPGDGVDMTVAGIGDRDGDGFDDVAVGFPASGRVDLYRGTAAGGGQQPTGSLDAPAAGEGFGAVLAGGDVDGDGLSDVVVGAPAADGAVYLFQGVEPLPSVRWAGGPDAALGTALQVTDLDADGLGEVAAGAPELGDTFGVGEGPGRVLVVPGRADADQDGVPDVDDTCPGGDDTFDLDGDGRPNGCDDPSLVVQGAVRRGAQVTLLSSADPGEQLSFVGGVGPPAPGPCLPVLGGACLGMAAPVLLGQVAADAAGVARLEATVPVGLPVGASLTLQAVVVRGVGGATSALSTPLTVVVAP